MVKAGLGVAVLARWIVGPQLGGGTLVARPLTRNGLQRQWNACFLRTRGGPPRHLTDFIDLIAAHGPAQGRALPKLVRRR
jgi:LysR family transcriptional regulator for metE and metH